MNKNTSSILPADKLIIIVLIVFTLSLFALFYSQVAYLSGFFIWRDKAAYIGWGGFISIIIFIFGSLTIKALETGFQHIMEKGLCVNIALNIKNQKLINNTHGSCLHYFIIVTLLTTSIALTAHGMFEALRLPRIKKVIIKIENLHPDLEGISIVQLTDLHISSTIRYQWVQRIVEQVNSLNPDIIALTGDIVDAPYSEIHHETTILANLRAKFGKFFVTGNHEYWHQYDKWSKEMKNLGFKVLFNSHCLISLGDALMLIGGVPDFRNTQQYTKQISSPVKAIGNVAKADIKVLLAHQPRSVYEAEEAGFDLQLSGHTHGGQVILFSWLRGFMQPFQSGLYVFKSIKIYVSNGARFWWIPLRFWAPSEISHIKLTGNM